MNTRKLGETLKTFATGSNQRCLIVVQGNIDWCNQEAQQLLGATEGIWVNDETKDNTVAVDSGRARSFLGQDLVNVVYNAHDGFDPDAFGILSGAISGGGFLILLTPISPHGSENFWPNDESHSLYLCRLSQLIVSSDKVVHIVQNQPLPSTTKVGQIFSTAEWKTQEEFSPAATADQSIAIEAIHKVVTGQRKRPVVLISDRGRGKSAALGIAAAQLITSGTDKIIVTGISKPSLQSVFRHAQTSDADLDQQIQWHPVEQLLEDKIPCDLLLIDEAATIPLQRLEGLLEKYSRIAMATTVHGYEGTGRGFMLRFSKTLDKLTRGWHQVKLEQPIRWRADDPLEQITNQLLVLDAALPAEVFKRVDVKSCDISIVKSQQLANNEVYLRQIFSLLVLAHYKTQPNDLKQLLDNPALRIYQITTQESEGGNVLGMAVVIFEGGLEPYLANQIFRGERRPAGQVLPEILGGQLGQKDAPELRMARIMRIVVHPAVQSQGLGTRLLQYVAEDLTALTDLFGTHFSASPALCDFWQMNQFLPVRVSLKPRPQSGSHSIVYLRWCNHQGQKLVQRAVDSFSRNLPAQLKTVLRELDPEIVQALLKSHALDPTPLTDEMMLDLQGYIQGARPAESIPEAITSIIIKATPISQSENSLLLIERVLLGKEWNQCSGFSGVDGKRTGEARLRKATLQLYELIQDRYG